MGKLIKVSDRVYEYLKREQKKLSREKLRHVPFSEVIAYLIKKDIDRIELTNADLEREIKALEKRVRLKAKKDKLGFWEGIIDGVMKEEEKER